MARDDWLKTAMTDDTVVAELLVRLKQSQAASSSPASWPRAVVPLRWGLRLPRSRPSASRCDAVQRVKEADSTRCSPTTPLSWSGGASPSGTADGFEESSFHTSLSPVAFRSKVLSPSTSSLSVCLSPPTPSPSAMFLWCWRPDLLRVILYLFDETIPGESFYLRLRSGEKRRW